MSYEVKVRIEGTSPLLQHRFGGQDESAKPKQQSGEPDYSKDAEQALYKSEAGIYQPSTHVEGALAKAAANFKIKGKRGKSYKDLIKAAVVVTPFAILHEKQKWEVDERPVVIRGQGRILRSRPRFDEWALNFNIEVNDDQFAIDSLQAILEYAGRFVGIGDYRPKFGRFRITEFKQVA